MGILCKIFGHKKDTRAVTYKGFIGYSTLCMRCKQSLYKTIDEYSVIDEETMKLIKKWMRKKAKSF